MRMRREVYSVLATGTIFLVGIAVVACTPATIAPPLGTGGRTSSNGGASEQGSSSPGAGGTPGLTIVLPDAAAAGGAGGSSTEPIDVWPPDGYINVTPTSYGAYALGPTPDSTTPPGTPGRCSGLFGVVRDFKMGTLDGGHPDFQTPRPRDDPGLVTDMLGDDGKPVYAHEGETTSTTSGKENFDQWYRDVEGVNMPFMIGLQFVENGDVVTFAASIGNRRGIDGGTGTGVPDSSYFPLDGQGWNDEARGDDRQQHNFAFTTEIHTSFTYNGGETFTFQGDDDVFVYINKHLAIDLGGIHEQQTKTVNLDEQAEALEISTGNIYDLAVFNAERHTTQSNFRIDTTMVFEDCGTVIP